MQSLTYTLLAAKNKCRLLQENQFEIYGVDATFDDRLNPIIFEFNRGPDLDMGF